MKRVLTLILAGFALNTFAQNDALKQKAATKADAIEKKIIDWRRDFHEHPELGNQEFRSAEIIAKHLKSLGIDVKTSVAKTGVVGILKGGKPGPVVALRADMDGLPVPERTPLPFASKVKAQFNGEQVNVMHACGHDTHMAILMGVAEVMASMKNDIKGTVKFIFQPAEEGGADIDNFSQGDQIGSRKMIADGAFKSVKPEVIFGLHVIAGIPSGHLHYKSGAILNSADNLRIQVKGQQVHGSMPWAGRDPIVASAQMINQLQTIISRRSDLSKGMGVVSIGNIQAGTAGNIIPEQVSMLGSIRSNNEDIRQNILNTLPKMIEHTAIANDVTATVELSSYAPVTMNHPALTEAMGPTFKAVAGDQVKILDNNASASEDFAYYGKLMPSLFVFLGATPKQQDLTKAAPNHSPYFIVDDATLKTGVETHVRFIMDYPKVANKVQMTWKNTL